MPRIDPNQLIRCLSVLLSPSGGIRSKDEVKRMASIMTKFSKKLVSKCVFILILKATEADLLDMFMSAGGWDLTYTWLSDATNVANWSLVVELIELLLLCPVGIERLKGNNYPKVIKMLSKDVNATEKVRTLACSVVEQWLAVVKGECEAWSAQSAQQSNNTSDESSRMGNIEVVKDNIGDEMVTEELDVDQSERLPLYKITIREGKKALAEVITSDRRSPRVDTVVDLSEENNSSSHINGQDSANDVSVKPDEGLEEKEDKSAKTSKAAKDSSSKLENWVKKLDSKKSQSNKNKTEKRSASSIEDFIKDRRKGKKNISPEKKVKLDLKAKYKEGKDIEKEKQKEKEEKEEKSSKTSKPAKDSSESNKKKTEKRPASSIEDFNKDRREYKKKISPEKKIKVHLKTKYKEGKDKEKDKQKEKDKEKALKEKNEKIKQEEKDRAVISKLRTPLSNMGKIQEKTQDDASKKPKEDDKPEEKVSKGPVEPKMPPPKDPKKYNISIGMRKCGEERPITVKTFNSKFRSTGLEELPPPPPKRKKIEKKDNDDKKLPVIKRYLYLPKEIIPPPEKKVDKEEKQNMETPLPPSKPKALGLQESDVFPDALTVANPVKDDKQRQRWASLADVKKEALFPVHKLDELKPVFKFYQDSLITSEDKKALDDKKILDDIKAEIKTEIDLDKKIPLKGILDLQQISQEGIEDEVAKGEEAIYEVLKQKENKNMERQKNRLPKGVLVYVEKGRGPKKGVQWKPDKELEAFKYFDLDAMERVNVTKNFTEMKQMERIDKRMFLSRKLAGKDIMEEKTPWKPLIPIDIEGNLIIPGNNGIEKTIQHSRERTSLQAIYFYGNVIPGHPAEPDSEIHAITELTLIPLNDQTGNVDSVISYKDKPWPEPKGYEPGSQARPCESAPQISQQQEMQQQPQQPVMMVPPPSYPPGPFPPVQFPMPNNVMPGPEWMVNGDINVMGGGNMMMRPGMNPSMNPGMNPGMPPNMHTPLMGPPDMYPVVPPVMNPERDFMPQCLMGQRPGMFSGPPVGGRRPRGSGPPFQGRPNAPPQMQQDIRPLRHWLRQNGEPSGGRWGHPSKGRGGGAYMPF